MNKRNLFLAVAVLLVCAVVAAVAIGGSTANKLTFQDVPKKAGERAEIYGILDTRSIRPIQGANLVEFQLVEEGTKERLKVLYDNKVSALPANFPAASHAKAGGTYDPVKGQFVADTVLTKCPSKYDQGAQQLDQAAVSRWQNETGLKVVLE